MKKPFMTWEDIAASFNLFCSVYGIGTLGMPSNFSRAGPFLASFGLIFMACVNIYASMLISKIMLLAPPHVKTFGDIGEWAMGRTGRILIVVSQIGYILLLSCAFLILGGTLLDHLFPDAFGKQFWIVIMAISVAPVCLVPTLKEGAGAAFAGCLGTVVGDLIGVVLVLWGMRGHGTVPAPDFEFEQVASMFGNLCLAYGAGIVIPAIQRQHSDPSRMPRIIFVTLTLISCLFLALAGSVYSAVGCQISGNLLFSVYEEDDGWTKLGFHTHKGAVILAYLGMQMHITIAFSVNLHPAFFVFERMILGMHKDLPKDLESPEFEAHTTPNDERRISAARSSKHSIVSMADVGREGREDVDESEDYKGANAIKYVILRLTMIALMVVVAVIFYKKFMDFADFIGASANAASCIVLPIVFYLVAFWKRIPSYERVAAVFAVVICSFFGVYVSWTIGRDLFFGGSDKDFPFCPAGNSTFYDMKDLQDTIYYRRENDTTL